MEKVNIIVSVFLLEFVSDNLLAKSFKIKNGKLYLLFLQIPKVCINILCMELINNIWLKLVLNVFTHVVVLLFITDTFNLKKVIYLLLSKLGFISSVTGLITFLLLWINGAVGDVISIKIDKNHQFLVVLCIILYIFAVFKIIRYLEENKKMKHFLANVSFFILDKHIRVYGLIDSGNSLTDPITKKPIILISKNSLRRFLTDCDIEKFINTNCYSLKCNTISNSDVTIPIYKCKDVQIKIDEGFNRCSCMLGVVDNKFENGKYDCLLPRDLL